MLTVFITSNQIPLHVHAVFCQLHVHCIHLARGMMRMRIPSLFRVRRSVIHRALNWLVTHNQYYRSNHVHIDINALEQLPHDGNLSQLTAITVESAIVALKLLVSLISRLVACSARIVTDKQTNKQTNTDTERLL